MSRPRLHVAPPRSRDSFGDLAAELSASYGLVLDDWQRLVLDDWLSIDDHGRWSSLTCGLSCPRQNGKNGILEVRELFGMVGRGEKILHTAHEVKTARKAFKRLQHFFGREVRDRGARFPELNSRVVELRNVNGQEAILLDNGGSVEIVARSKNSGRGFTADVLVMDEAQEMSEEDIEALMPTTSAAPLGNPQWIFTGTPPGPKANGEVFTRTRTDALGESPVRICWHEWSACDPSERGSIDPDDRGLWYATNPSLGANRAGELQIEVVEGERSRFSIEGFLRERLGVWDDPVLGRSAIPADSWAACAHGEHPPLVAWAIDITPESTAATVAGSDGTHVEVVKHGAGTAWVVPEVLAHRDRVRRVVLDPAGPAIQLVSPLENAGIEVKQVSTAEAKEACQAFLTAVLDGGLRHNAQPELDAAAANAAQRLVGDGGWLWSRRKSSVDISPLYAATLARWAALSNPPPATAGFVDLSDYLDD